MTEDTLIVEPATNEGLIEEMMRDKERVELPSDLTTNPVINKGDSNLEAPMVVNKISSAGYLWLWDTRTHERIPVISYMVRQKLNQRRQDGAYQFTITDPKKLPQRGTVKCMLHSQGAERKHYDELGFRVCDKDNITNKFQLQQHMSKKHPVEWKTIEQERLELERAEDRAFQRLLMQMGARGIQAEKTIVEELAEIPDLPTLDEPVKLEKALKCEKCGKEFHYNKAYRSHLKICK